MQGKNLGILAGDRGRWLLWEEGKGEEGADTRGRASREGRAAGKGLTSGDHWAAAHAHAQASGSGCRPSVVVERGRAVCWAGRGELGYGPDGKVVLGRVSGTGHGKERERRRWQASFWGEEVGRSGC